MKSNYKRLFQNMGIFTLANFTSRILSFLILPLYTYYLTTEEYGTIDLVNTTIQLVFPVLSLSIVDAVLRFCISTPQKRETYFSIGIKIICMGTIPLIICTVVSFFFFRKYSSVLIYFVLIYFFQALNSLFGAFAKAIDRTKETAIITSLTGIIILCLNVYFVAIAQQGINGYWTSTILGNLAGVFLFVIVCKLYIYWKKESNSKQLLKEMLRYSIPLIPNALFWWINSSLDRWTLTLMTGMSLVGLYSCANKIPMILSTINSIFNQAWNLSLFQSDNEKEQKSLFETTYFYFNEIMFCCTIGIILLSKFIASFMFSKEFYQAWIFVPLLTFGVYYNSLNGLLGSAFTARKQTRYIFTTTLLGSVVNIVLNFPFVYFGKGIGAAIATLLSYLAVWIIRANKVKKLFQISVNYKRSLLQVVLLSVETFLVMNNMLWGISFIIVALYCFFFALNVLKNWKKQKIVI